MKSIENTIILFKADGKFEMFKESEEQKILAALKGMEQSEKDRTEIAIFVTPEGDYRRFILYPDGRYPGYDDTKNR